MPRWTRAIGPVALALALAILLARLALAPGPPAAPQIGQVFPPLALGTLAGTPPLTPADLRRGRWTVVNLFASWCVPCRVEAPQLVALHRAGLTVTGIAVNDTPADTARFITGTRAPFARVGLDFTGVVQTALGTAGLPETWLIDGSGIIRHRVRGDLHPEDVTAIVRAAR